MTMPRRQRICERRGARHYAGRVFDPAAEWGPVHTCATPQEHAAREAEARLRARYGHVPANMAGLHGLVRVAEHEGTPSAHEGQTLVDGRWVCTVAPPPAWLDRTRMDFDPYENGTGGKRGGQQ